MLCLAVLTRRPSVPTTEDYYMSFGIFGKSGIEEFFREYA
jgi:hypothetical protein